MREIKREKARQVVERVRREAHERAANEAHDRAAAEARLRSERAVVQRAQADARERAAIDAKGRAERAAGACQRYEVIPLSPNSGLIEWVPNCDTLHQLIWEYRDTLHNPLQRYEVNYRTW
ncbi:hypothetical protein Lser_V15G44696 [Lactuca serriola]